MKKFAYTRRVIWTFLTCFLVLGILASSAPTSASDAGNSVILTQEITISALNNEQWMPAVAYNSKHDEYLVVWYNFWGGNRDIYAQRISSKGQLLSLFIIAPGPGQVTYDRMQPSVAYDADSDRYLVVYMRDAYGTSIDWDIYGRFIPWNGPSESLNEFPICNWTSPQWYPEVVYGRAQLEFMVVWANKPSGQPIYISAARVNHETGAVIDDLTVTSSAQDQTYPDIAYNLARNEYLVVWDYVGTNHDIYGLRLNGVGSALGTGEIYIAGWPDDEETPTVAACRGADQYLVGWQSLVSPPTNYDIYARYIAGDGTLGTVFLVDGTTAPEKNADATCMMDGQQYLIAWQTMYSHGRYGVWARRIFPNATMEDSFGLVLPGTASDRTEPAVAGGPANYLVVWEHDREATAYQDIHGRIIYLYQNYLPTVLR